MKRSNRLYRCLSRKQSKILILFLFVLILMMNLMTVKIADDFIYSQSSGLADIIAREYEQYMTWSGRSVAHFLDRISLSLPRFLFMLANSLVFIWLTILAAFHGGSSPEEFPFHLALAAGLIFCFAPMFGETVLWQTGSFNYLWTAALILTYLVPYRYALDDEAPEMSLPLIALYSLAGAAAGWTNENTAGAMILIILGTILRNFLLKKKVRPWMWAGFVSSCIGLLIMLKAPGNAIRSLSFPDHSGLSSLLISAYEASLVISGSGTSGMRTLWFLFAGALGLAFTVTKKKEQLYPACLFALSSLAAVFAMIFSPVYINYSRSMFGSCVFLIIAIVSLFGPAMKHAGIRKAGIAALSVLTAFSAMNYITAMTDLVNTRYQIRNYDRYIRNQKEAGNLNPVIPAIRRELMTRYDPLFDLEGLQGECDHWVNVNFAAINGLESITATAPGIWTAIYMDGDPVLMNITSLDDYLLVLGSDEDYCFTITSTAVSDPSYDSLRSSLSNFLGKPLDKTYILAVRDKDGTEIMTSDEELYTGWDMDGHYMYLSSMAEASRCDIVFGADNLSNKNNGITITVYSRKKQKIVDEISWQPGLPYGIRCSSEQAAKRS